MAILPEEVFKRRQRHNNTPASTMLILTNFIVVFSGVTLFSHGGQTNWFFWVVAGVLALYNFFTIRRNREEFTKIVIISYCISIVILIVIFFLFRGQV